MANTAMLSPKCTSERQIWIYIGPNSLTLSAMAPPYSNMRADWGQPSPTVVPTVSLSGPDHSPNSYTSV